MAEELIHLEVVHGLMVAVGNLDYVASQRHASISLEVSMVVHGGGHHSTGSAPRAPEQKGFLHCEVFFFSLSIADTGLFRKAGVTLPSGKNCVSPPVCLPLATPHT